MPQKKDLKQLTRNRMKKTGESYTTARAQLLRKKDRPEPTVVPESKFAELAGMSDVAVRQKSGKTWKQWVRTLDTVDAASMPHREIAMYVHRELGVPAWWAQMVTVGYERIRGLRDVGQRRGGKYDANKSKTIAVPVGRLYRAFSTARTRNRWLPGVTWNVRKSTTERSIRLTWEDGCPVELYFTAKGDAQSQVAVQHRQLARKTDIDRVKAYWGERLDVLAQALAKG